MDDIVLRDLSGAIKNSTEKWPLIIDQNELAATFLRYRDTNYMNCLDAQSMKPDRFRLALVGAIRYGKPFVVDLMKYDQELLESVRTVCGQVTPRYPELFDELANKRILLDDHFMRLVEPGKDGKEYEAQYFNKSRLDHFKLLFVTSNPYPCKWLLQNTLPIKIVSAGKADDLYDF